MLVVPVAVLPATPVEPPVHTVVPLAVESPELVTPEVEVAV
jgi:hypothetical protein